MKSDSTTEARRRARANQLKVPFLHTGPFDSVRDPVLREAAARVAHAWVEWAPAPGAPAAVVAELGVLAACAEAGGGLPRAGQPSSALRRRLLPALRAEVLRCWTALEAAPDGGHMVATLRAFDAMARALAAEPDSARPHPPAAPEGLDLIVEVAHDIRSPLTSILFLAETLRRGQSGEVSALQHRQIGLIYSAALGMVSLTSDMIELAHGGERLVEEHGSPFAVSEMLAAVCDLVHPIAEEKKVALRVLPLPCDHRTGSPAALSRVLLNLVTNALKYTDEGFVEITARARSASLVEFAVRDTGAGMDEETQSTLFDPFRPGRRNDRYGFSGTGLGLAICRRLVRALGSELHYESSPGWGTRFYFEVELPVATL